jgi:hypothetical protein
MFSSSARAGGDRRRVGRLRHPSGDDDRDQIRRNCFESQKISGPRTLQERTLHRARRLTRNFNDSFTVVITDLFSVKIDRRTKKYCLCVQELEPLKEKGTFYNCNKGFFSLQFI